MLGLHRNGVSRISEIFEACSAESEIGCAKGKHAEGGRFAASTGGVPFDGYGYVASWTVCAACFSLPSGGTLWCGISVSGFGGWAEGHLGLRLLD